MRMLFCFQKNMTECVFLTKIPVNFQIKWQLCGKIFNKTLMKIIVGTAFGIWLFSSGFNAFFYACDKFIGNISFICLGIKFVTPSIKGFQRERVCYPPQNNLKFFCFLEKIVKNKMRAD